LSKSTEKKILYIILSLFELIILKSIVLHDF